MKAKIDIHELRASIQRTYTEMGVAESDAEDGYVRVRLDFLADGEPWDYVPVCDVARAHDDTQWRFYLGGEAIDELAADTLDAMIARITESILIDDDSPVLRGMELEEHAEFERAAGPRRGGMER